MQRVQVVVRAGRGPLLVRFLLLAGRRWRRHLHRLRLVPLLVRLERHARLRLAACKRIFDLDAARRPDLLHDGLLGVLDVALAVPIVDVRNQANTAAAPLVQVGGALLELLDLRVEIAGQIVLAAQLGRVAFLRGRRGILVS